MKSAAATLEVVDAPVAFAGRAVPDFIARHGRGAARRLTDYLAGQLLSGGIRSVSAESLAHFCSWVDRGKIELWDCTPGIIRAYAEEVEARFPPTRARVHIDTVRHLFDWAFAEGLVDGSPVTNLHYGDHGAVIDVSDQQPVLQR